MLFHEDGNQNEAWLITRLHPIGQCRYRRTTFGGCRWHARTEHAKKDFTSFMRNRFTLEENDGARSNNNSKVFKYTMLEYTACKDEFQYALCKIVRREAPITAQQGSHSKKRRISTKSSKQSKKIAVGPSEFHATMGHVNSTIMGLTDHECGNNKNLYKDETSRSHADEFMQEGGNQNQEDIAVYELVGIIMTKLLELVRRRPQAARGSHLGFINGWPIHDASEISFGFETWHAGLVLGQVTLISSSRFILLKAWPDFAKSSEAANQQILSSLEPLDLVVIAFLPGISEEFLFRGGLMPLFGLDWKSALATGVVFGILHLNGGRKYDYAIWATLVGFAYGLATIASSSLLVPMASHSLNNLIGALFWRFKDFNSIKTLK